MFDNPSGTQLRKHHRLIITLPLKFFVDEEAVAKDGTVIDVGAGGEVVSFCGETRQRNIASIALSHAALFNATVSFRRSSNSR
jgi:hypothetical protein